MPGKILIVAEKPSVARDIAAALGKVPKKDEYFENAKYVITSAVGHLVELYKPQDYDKKWGRWTLQNLPIIPQKFGLKATEKTEAQYRLVKKLMARKDIDSVINACDAGREGELIFTYLYELAECKKPYQRLWMQSMTPDAIREAFNHLRTPTQMQPLQDAARSRSEADWLIGMNGTRAITSRLYGARVKEVATVGRVQTPTLAMVIERELAIRNFKPTPYWRLTASFLVTEGNYEGVYQKENFSPKTSTGEHDRADRLWNEAEAKALLSRVNTATTWTVTQTTKRGEQAAPRLYDLTTLQREANNRFGFSAASTLKIAQSLYERHKVLTYPRTDSQALPEDYIATVKKTLGALQGDLGRLAHPAIDNVRPNKRIFNNAQVSDHFAIIPTGEAPDKLNEQEQKIYDMVARRFIAIFYPAALIDNTVRITSTTDTIGPISFKTEGKVLVDPGWMTVYGRASLDSEPLPAMVSADLDKATRQDATLHTEATKPPPRYTEATLLSAMESAGKMVDDEELADAMKERGLGTPATRASIIDHLINTSYLTRERRDLAPTAKAETLYDFLKVLGADALTRPDLTGEWEQGLRRMEEGKLSREEFIKGIQEQARAIVASAQGFEESKEAAVAMSFNSPTDGMPMQEKTRFFESQDGKVKIWKVVSGRRLAPDEVAHLLANGSIGPLDGFVSKFGRPFSAKLKLDETYTPKFDFEGQARVSVTTEDLVKGEKLGRCPVNDDGDVYAYDGGYACQCAVGDKPTCGFKLPKLLLSQELSIDEARKLVSGAETSPLPNFVSKKSGKKFTSILYLKKTGQLGWKFPPRAPRPKGGKFGKKGSKKADDDATPPPPADAGLPPIDKTEVDF